MQEQSAVPATLLAVVLGFLFSLYRYLGIHSMFSGIWIRGGGQQAEALSRKRHPVSFEPRLDGSNLRESEETYRRKTWWITAGVAEREFVANVLARSNSTTPLMITAADAAAGHEAFFTQGFIEWIHAGSVEYEFFERLGAEDPLHVAMHEVHHYGRLISSD